MQNKHKQIVLPNWSSKKKVFNGRIAAVHMVQFEPVPNAFTQVEMKL